MEWSGAPPKILKLQNNHNSSHSGGITCNLCYNRTGFNTWFNLERAICCGLTIPSSRTCFPSLWPMLALSFVYASMAFGYSLNRSHRLRLLTIESIIRATRTCREESKHPVSPAQLEKDTVEPHNIQKAIGISSVRRGKRGLFKRLLAVRRQLAVRAFLGVSTNDGPISQRLGGRKP